MLIRGQISTHSVDNTHYPKKLIMITELSLHQLCLADSSNILATSRRPVTQT